LPLRKEKERFLKTRPLEYKSKSHKLELYLNGGREERTEKKLHSNAKTEMTNQNTLL
jgi:hypothetical protein